MPNPIFSIEHGDVLEHLRKLPANTFHAVLCDPPYGFSFMNKKWDYDVPNAEVWREMIRVLRPGAPLVSFGGPRTYHRVATAIEDGGFELRDCLHWLFGKGFPKSQNVSLMFDKAVGAKREVVGQRVLTGNAAISLKEKGGTYGVQVGSASKTVDVTAPSSPMAKLWQGFGTALKPAYEPIVLARKPLEGTMVQNVTAWGCGPLDIDGSRVGTEKLTINRFTDGAHPFGGAAGSEYEAHESEGRWPPNLILDSDVAAMLDAQVGISKSTPFRENVAEGAVLPMAKRTAGGYSDSGGPSRFFPRADYSDNLFGQHEAEELLSFWYGPKVSTKERERGCEGLPKKSAGETTGREDGSEGLNNPRAGAGRTGGAHNFHPTLKPIELIKYLARLIKPATEDAMILVPYSGSGSEMIGCMLAGWSAVVGIEGEADYIQIARARIPAWVLGAEAA